MSLSGEERVHFCLPVDDSCQTFADTIALLLALMIALTIAVNLITLILHRIHYYLKKYLGLFPSSVVDNIEEKKPEQKCKARMQPAMPTVDGCRGTRHREQENRSCYVRPYYLDRLEEQALNLRDTDEEKACRYRHHRAQEEHHYYRDRERPSGTYSRRSNYDGLQNISHHRGSTAALGPELPRLQAMDVKVRPGVIYREVLPHSRPRVIRLDSTPPMGHPDSRPAMLGSRSPSVADPNASAISPRPYPHSKPIGATYDSILPINPNQFQYPESPEMVYNPAPIFQPQTSDPINQQSRPQSRSNNMGLDEPAKFDLSHSPNSAPLINPDIQEDTVGPNPLLHINPSRRPYTISHYNDQNLEKPSHIIPEYLLLPGDQHIIALPAKDSRSPSPKHGYSQNFLAVLSQPQISIHHPPSPLAASHDLHSGRVVYDARALHGHARGPEEVKEEEEEEEESRGQFTLLKSAESEEKAAGLEGANNQRSTNPYNGTKLTFNLPPPINKNHYFQTPRTRMSMNSRAQTPIVDHPPESSMLDHSVQ